MDNTYSEIFEKYGFYCARILGSKSRYIKHNPENLVIFNSRIYLKSYYEREKNKAISDFFAGQEKEIWHGDLDLNKDITNLYRIWLDIRQSIVITSESGRKIIEIGY